MLSIENSCISSQTAKWIIAIFLLLSLFFHACFLLSFKCNKQLYFFWIKFLRHIWYRRPNNTKILLNAIVSSNYLSVSIFLKQKSLTRNRIIIWNWITILNVILAKVFFLNWEFNWELIFFIVFDRSLLYLPKLI